MRKYLAFIAMLTMIGFIGCTGKPEGGLSATAQKNLDASRAIGKCFDTRDFSKVGDYIATDCIDHSGPNGEIKGLDSMKAAFDKDMESVSTMKSDPIKELADDDYVMAWYRFTGTWKNNEMGHKAGDPFEMKSMEVSRFKDGKVVEHWAMMEPGEVMKMMGSMQAPPAGSETKKDTVKKM
jgi:predicted ester cyclase